MSTTEYWFKPKTHGYGASPTHWKGWVATLAYALAVAAFSVACFGLDRRAIPGAVQWLGWVTGIVAATAAFVALARRKTDGDWRWRWGRD